MSLPQLTVELDAELLEDVQGLAAYIGLEPEEAFADALCDWVGRNAPLYDYDQGEGS
jgi:hypothetical protein